MDPNVAIRPGSGRRFGAAGIDFCQLSPAQEVWHTNAREELIREIIYSEKLQSLSLIDPLTQTFDLCYLDQVLPRGADANAVLKLAEERLKSEPSPDQSGHFSGELARSGFEVHRGGREW